MIGSSNAPTSRQRLVERLRRRIESTRLGLQGTLRTVVASEISPLMRGHVNAYPLRATAGARNGGAMIWWDTRPDDTDELFGWYEDAYPGAILQINHPLSGVASFAGWSPGRTTTPRPARPSAAWG